MGRNADCTIPLEFEEFLENIFEVVKSAEVYKVRDDVTGSRNGTFLSSKKLRIENLLEKGDMIKLGSIALKYLQGDPERLTYDKLNLEANTDKHTGCFNKGTSIIN